MKRICFFAIALLIHAVQSKCQTFVTTTNEKGSFSLFTSGSASTIYTDANDYQLIQKVAELLHKDMEAVSGQQISATTTLPAKATQVIIIGSPEKSSTIQQLIKSGKLQIDRIKGKWEAYQLQVIQQPFKGIDQALVITGNDRRGAAYGVLELSQQIGVSPWYWWADVPVMKKNAAYIKTGVFTDAPKVKYRGIFINDEAPALSGWSKEKFGGFNHKFYSKVFELLLRQKANYIWPAMWGNAFYDDDSLNIKTAEEYGIVIGTSHHEPLMRAHDEWRRYGKGKWNYDSNEVQLKKFWQQGMERTTNEKIVTIGMRGDGDEPMSRETATALLERIVKDQREIITQTTGRQASETPQLWALYKEVQDYYDKGMRVPDDVTLLLCDDNWGNIRKLPKLNEPARSGGYGIYYHFDYVGGPRNYKWINTNNLARVWEQMHLACEYNARQIWIVNVGDIKPMELPISFFLDYAWNPDTWNENNLRNYYTQWASGQFGPQYAQETGDILRLYAQYSARIKPELLNASTYSLHNYNEANTVLDEWKKLLERAEKIQAVLPTTSQDAFFQLVLHPIKAFCNLHQLYNAVALNQWNASLPDIRANAYADSVKKFYLQDSLITLQYHQLAGGKWNHMMDQTHIGYTYWQQPPFNTMPAVKYVPDSLSNYTTVWQTIHPGNTYIIPRHTQNTNTFYEKEGYVSMEATHFSKAINSNSIRWKTIPDIGKTGSGMTVFPVTTATRLTAANNPALEYDFYCSDTGRVKIQAYFSPTLNFHNDEGLQYAIAIDNEVPQVIILNKDDNNVNIWNKWVADNIIIKTTSHHITKPGNHVLKYSMVTPGVVVQKMVIDFGGVKQSYLGPPETKK